MLEMLHPKISAQQFTEGPKVLVNRQIAQVDFGPVNLSDFPTNQALALNFS